MRIAFAVVAACAVMMASTVTAAEPPLQLSIQLGDQRVIANAGKSTHIKMGDTSIPVRVDVLPTRQFDEIGLRFEYPAHFPWEHDDESTWTLDGNSAVIIITRSDVDSTTTAGELLDMIEGSLRQSRRSPREPVVLNTRSGALSGVATTVRMATSRIRNEAYIVRNESTLATLILQDALDDDGNSSAEFVDMRKRLAATLEFSKP